METMTALRAHTRGGPEVLVVEQAPVPRLRDGQVLVAVHAAGVTFTELEWDETWQRDGRDRTPVVVSHEFCGVMTARTRSADTFQVGDAVFGLVPFDRDGAAAEYVAVEATDLAVAPVSIPSTEAAGLPLSALTAWQALVEHARVREGQRVLVHGGAGAVGGFAVQLAVALGAEVTATCLGSEVLSVLELGAKRVVDADRIAFDATGERWDVVVDTVGGSTLERSWPVVRRGGHLITLRQPPSEERARQLGIHATFFVVRPDRDGLTALAHLVDTGRLRVVLGATYPLRDGRRAYLSGTQRDRPAGKTVLVVAADQGVDRRS